MSEQQKKDPMPDDEFQRLNDAWHQSAGMDPADRDDFRNFLKFKHQKLLEEYDRPAENGQDTLNYVGKKALGALDYGAGMIRTPALATAAALAGRADLIHKQDFKDAFIPGNPPAPGTGEWLKRAGVPEGPSLSDAIPGAYAPAGQGEHWYSPEKGGMLDPTARGAIAFVGDAGLSPPGVRKASKIGSEMAAPGTAELAAHLSPAELSALKKAAGSPTGASAETIGKVLGQTRESQKMNPDSFLKKLGKASVGMAVDPVDYSMSKGGRAVYDSAFGAADQAAAGKGGRAVSDIMFQEGAWGGDRSLLKQADQIKTRRAADVRSIVDDVNRKTPKAEIHYKPGESRTIFTMDGLDDSAPVPPTTQSALPPGAPPAPGVGAGSPPPVLTDPHPRVMSEPPRGMTPGSPDPGTGLARNTAVGPNRSGVGPQMRPDPIVLPREDVPMSKAPADSIADILMSGKEQYSPGQFQVDPNTGLRVPLRRLYDPAVDMLRKSRRSIGEGAEAKSAWDTIASERRAADPQLRRQSVNLDQLLDMKDTYQERAKHAGAYGDMPSVDPKPNLNVNSKIEAGLLGKAYKSIAQRAREESEGLVDSVSPGQGGMMHLKNRDIGALLEAEKAMTDNTRMVGSPVMKAIRYVAPGAGTKTGVGLGMAKLAPWLSALGRATALNQYGEKSRQLSPYDQLMLEMKMNQGEK